MYMSRLGSSCNTVVVLDFVNDADFTALDIQKVFHNAAAGVMPYLQSYRGTIRVSGAIGWQLISVSSRELAWKCLND